MAQSPPGLQVHQSQLRPLATDSSRSTASPSPFSFGRTGGRDAAAANYRGGSGVVVRGVTRRLALRGECDIRQSSSAIGSRDPSSNCWQARPSRLLLRHLTGGPRPPLQAGWRPPDTSKLAALLPDAVAAQSDDAFFRGLRVRGEVGDAMGLQLAMVLTNDRTSGLSPMEGEMLAQLDDAGQFTAVFIGPTDCLGGDVIDSKHQLNPRISARLPTLPQSGRDEEVRQGLHFGVNLNSRPTTFGTIDATASKIPEQLQPVNETLSATTVPAAGTWAW